MDGQPIGPRNSVEGFELKIASPTRLDVLINFQSKAGNLGKFGLG